MVTSAKARCALWAVVGLLTISATGWGAEPPRELKVNDAVLMVDGKATPPAAQKDTFGPGCDGVTLNGNSRIRNELRYACKDVPEGDYYVGLSLLMPWPGYFGFADGIWQLQLYRNDTRVPWTSHTEPLRPENAAEKNAYQAEMRVDQPLHVKPGDVLRVIFNSGGGNFVLGPIRLYKEKPAGAVMEFLPIPDSLDDKFHSLWLYADWTEPQRTPTKIVQSCTFFNPGVQPRTFTVKAQARDYLMAPLMPDRVETLTLAPGQTVTNTYEFKPGTTGRDRLTLAAESEGVFPAVRKAKFYVQNRTQGPRPNTCLNGPDWEMCFVPGAEPGEAPPAGAAWKKITVPSLVPIHEVRKEGDKEVSIDHHCMWYRKSFVAPNIQGERAILKCGQVFSEAWFYLNGKAVGHELHGPQPFEVDITTGYKPGVTNELLIAVRDWIAYSPKNQERVRNGEPVLFRQDVIDAVDYAPAANIGIDRSVWLEGRPAVSVDDVFVVTSVREKTLKLKYRLMNKTARDQNVTVTPRVWDEGRQVNLFKSKSIMIPANKTAELWFDTAWKNPRYWWRDDPHLYALETAIQPQEGKPDQHWQRFGFRELWIDGYSWVMNGVRVKFKGSYGNSGNFCDFFPGCCNITPYWEPEKRLESFWNGQTDQVQNYDLQVCRTHYEETLDMADETGLMAKRGGDFNQVAFTFNNKFWEGGLQQNIRFMDVSKNHPSVIYWEAGNENMWGHIYIGEAARVFANRWQVKIAQAMRDFDLMKRPIDWDADGDLFGKWEEHALHYPRDGVVDVPNGVWWGPWDGKTIAQNYMFGPIILGKKPICLGESAWVEPGRPYVETMMLGDQAYAGGYALTKAEALWAHFFSNGYRDGEFAYLDTLSLYTPFLKPQTVVLKQETSSFYGGRALERDVNIHNDVRHPAKLTLKWSLMGKNGSALVSSKSKTFRLKPAELKRYSIELRLPAVKQPVDATWRVELLDGERRLHQEEREWRICPGPSVHMPEALDLAVYDPAGDTAAALERMGIRFTRLTDLTRVPGRALLIGKNAFRQAAQGAWREALAGCVQNGGKVLILEQNEALDFLPVNLQLAKDSKRTISFVRAADHPVMKGLTDSDLCWWADDHYVVYGNWQKPAAGRWLPLVDIGTGDGLTQMPLVEVYNGKGSFLLCQLLVMEKALTAPPAGQLLQNMLDYLASPACFRTAGRTAVLAGPDSPLRKVLADSRLVSTDLTGKIGDLVPGQFEVAIVDVATALDEGAVGALRTFADGGGRVLLHRGTPEKQALLEKLLGIRLRFFPVAKEPQDIQNRVLRTTDCSGLLAGISNHELYWITPSYLNLIRWNNVPSYNDGVPAEERIAEYYCWPGDDAGDNVKRLTRPGALIQVPAGKGYFALSQLRLDQPPATTASLVARLRNLLLTNLGCDLKGDSDTTQVRLRRLQQYQFTPVDLTPYANRGWGDDKEKGIVGWANQGENDMRELPTGLQTFAGIPFLIGTPKGAITLFSTMANNTVMPRAVKGIKIGRKADALFFLHTTAWGAKEPFKYVVHYEDGTNQEIPILTNQQLFGWWDDPQNQELSEAMARFGGFVAWKGHNSMTRAQKRWGIMLPGYEWPNPHPEKIIKDLDFVTLPESEGCVPLLAAITAASIQADEGIVTDIINTKGIKVKLGTQEKDIYYIGAAGIEENHAFYAKAMAAHRAMVVGQKVKLVYDVVRQNGAGQTVAYVYLSEDTSAGNLLNGKVLEAGLSRLGDFEGNDRLRMVLMNTGEPAKWKKAGMWADEKK